MKTKLLGMTAVLLTLLGSATAQSTSNRSLSVQQRLDLGQSPFQIYQINPQLLDSLFGKVYQGGVIFYLNTTTGDGLVSSTSDLSSAAWGCTDVWVNTSDVVGQGNQNTKNIIGSCGSNSPAATACSNLNQNGYSDWYLPNKGELQLMWSNLRNKGYGNFADANWTTDYQYWSSSQGIGSSFSVAMRFWDAAFTDYSRTSVFRIRPVRTFEHVAPIPQTFTAIAVKSGVDQAVLKCNFKNEGNTEIWSEGFCYGFTENPDTNDLVLHYSVSGDSIQGVLRGLLKDTVYYVRAFTEDMNGISYGQNTRFRTDTIKLGGLYKNGIIVYVFEKDGEKHGLIAAPSNFQFGNYTGFRWNCWNPQLCMTGCSAFNTDTTYGSGFNNCGQNRLGFNQFGTNDCNLITAGGSAPDITAVWAAYYYSVLPDQSDTTQWFLPSLEEMMKVAEFQSTYRSLELQIGFYWTSSAASNSPMPTWRDVNRPDCCWQARCISVATPNNYRRTEDVIGVARVRPVKYF